MRLPRWLRRRRQRNECNSPQLRGRIEEVEPADPGPDGMYIARVSYSDAGWWTAAVEGLDGPHIQGERTFRELRGNVREVIGFITCLTDEQTAYLGVRYVFDPSARAEYRRCVAAVFPGFDRPGQAGDLPESCLYCGAARVIWPREWWLYQDRLGPRPCLSVDHEDRAKLIDVEGSAAPTKPREGRIGGARV